MLLGHENESYRFASTARMSRKLPPKKIIIGKNVHYLHKKGINCYTNACSESYASEKTILYVSHGIYSALHSVHDQAILFTWPGDHGECSRLRQNDRPSVQTTARETSRVQTKIAKEQPRIGPTSNAIGPIVWAIYPQCNDCSALCPVKKRAL
jgi:hypothetical protein